MKSHHVALVAEHHPTDRQSGEEDRPYTVWNSALNAMNIVGLDDGVAHYNAQLVS